MKVNMGLLDRLLRIIFALVIVFLYFQGIITGLLAIILGFFALIFVITSIIGFCPMYTLFNFSTCFKKK